MTATPEELITKMQQLSRAKSPGSFVPKLNEGQRIAIFALHKHGATREALAHVFGIHRNSVAHLINEHSSRYKATRKAYYGMGAKEAFRQYVTTAMVEQIEAFQLNPPTIPEPKRNVDDPDPRARQRQGNWTNDAGEPMKIMWVDKSSDFGFFGPGWYPHVELEGQWRIITGANHTKPFKTSTEAYNEGKKL